jgi:hypothetical protein
MEFLDSDARKQRRVRLSRSLPDFETHRQVRERKTNLINHLMAGNRAARLVGRKLRRCRENRACGSPICPRCVRNLRKSLIRGAIKCITRL